VSGNQPNSHLILLDIDGTLVDSQDFIVEAQRRAFEAHGLPMPERERALSVVGLSLLEAFTVLAGKDAPVENLTQAYRTAWHEMREDPAFLDPFFEGALDFVRDMIARGDVKLGIATGKARRGVVHLMDCTGWHDHFVTIQTADDHPSKPAPDMILKAMEETGTAPNHTIMIGDTSYDMAMAKAAGVHAIGVAWGYHQREALLHAGAELIVEDFAHLTRAIADLLADARAPIA
jgi:phosphoglycolate phosphatase